MRPGKTPFERFFGPRSTVNTGTSEIRKMRPTNTPNEAGLIHQMTPIHALNETGFYAKRDRELRQMKPIKIANCLASLANSRPYLVRTNSNVPLTVSVA